MKQSTVSNIYLLKCAIIFIMIITTVTFVSAFADTKVTVVIIIIKIIAHLSKYIF